MRTARDGERFRVLRGLNLSLILAFPQANEPLLPLQLSPVGPCGPSHSPCLPHDFLPRPPLNPTVLLPRHGAPVSLLTSQLPSPPNPFLAPARAHGSWLPCAAALALSLPQRHVSMLTHPHYPTSPSSTPLLWPSPHTTAEGVVLTHGQNT